MAILMVEDEALILEIMAETLDEAGYDVVTVADGVQALALLNDRPARFSALFSDYHLPGGVTAVAGDGQLRAAAQAVRAVADGGGDGQAAAAAPAGGGVTTA